MSTYDLKRLEVAIQYVRRMSEGRNPVTNKPAPNNEVLTNINVHRCLKFIDEVLTDVHNSGGSVGMSAQRTRAPKPSASEAFPYETLQQYRYLQDQQISYFLKQLEEYLPEGEKMPVSSTTITLWLRENGYLEKKAINDTGKENSVPTRKGEELGLYSEKAGLYPNEYYRVFYNEDAQRFILRNFRKILTESEEIRERNRSEKKRSAPPRSARQGGGSGQFDGGTGMRGNSDAGMQGGGASRHGGAAQGGGASRHSGAAQGGGASRYSGAAQGGGNANMPGGSRQDYNAARQPSPDLFSGFSPEPAPAEDLPKEYYDMLSDGWAPSDDGIPW